jgi:guanylate kinase
LQKIIIITAPSGSGKSTLVKRLLDAMPELSFSVSACTRSPRGNEQHGIEYYFISVEEFKQHIQQDDFIEWEMVYEGKYYGTLKTEIDRIINAQLIPLVDIDIKGALKVKQQYEHALSIFIKAPNLEILKERLIKRGTDSAESIQERLDKAAEELQFAPQFQTTLVNDDLELAAKELIQLVKSFLYVS